MATNVPVTPETPITIKITINENHKKVKLPLKDLGASVLLDKLRLLLGITPEQEAVFERFSDSAGGFVVLDPNNPAVFKTLNRAAKAKLKLRLKVSITPDPNVEVSTEEPAEMDDTSKSAQELVIARTPLYMAPRDYSTAFDRRSVGSGIFQFRESRPAQASSDTTTLAEAEAPVPRPFTASTASGSGPFTASNNDFWSTVANPGAQRELALRTRPAIFTSSIPTWSVYCNECDGVMNNAHFHCSVCDGGDFDLCESCVGEGKLCPGEGHWLIKRFISDGKVVNSTTERIAPKPRKAVAVKEETPSSNDKPVPSLMPGAFAAADIKCMEDALLSGKFSFPTRTCNSCVVVMPEREFVTCTNCDDYDLCRRCHTDMKHGHHPAHSFKPAVESTELTLMEKSLLPAGRNVRHHAICDGCDESIFGVRHKCFNCPDFDYCGDCIGSARSTHPQHRFATLYEPLQGAVYSQDVRHYGIYCDGPLCKSVKIAIRGIRYKCVVCHDTDFCANCEALPGNHHNKTHPLIKFKTPVNNLTISTTNESQSGVVTRLGDQSTQAPSPERVATPAAASLNATTPVQTVAETKPSVDAKTEVSSITPAVGSLHPSLSTPAPKPAELDAQFLHDTIPDGKAVAPNTRFTQVWTIRNPGPHEWPAGCSVRFTGGDNMLNVDNAHAASVTDMNNATESNVVGRPVPVGEQIAFKVIMKAPERVGRAISYWRLKTADGTPFGHRLWCDIIVKSEQESESKLAAPAAVGPPKPAAFRPPQWSTMPLPPSYQLSRSNMSRAEALRQHHSRLMREQSGPYMVRNPADETTPVRQFMPPHQVNAQSYYKQYQERMHALRASQTEQVARMRQARDEQVRKQQQHKANGTESSAMALHGDWAKKMEELVTAMVVKQDEKVQTTGESEKDDAAANETEKNETGETETEKKLEGSQMIFPTLDKESPANSTYQSMTSSSTDKATGKAAYVEDEETGEKVAEATHNDETTTREPISPMSSPSISEKEVVGPSEIASSSDEAFEDVTDDLEVLSADEESEDDGFLTDEEYDILDASDQETVASSI